MLCGTNLQSAVIMGNLWLCKWAQSELLWSLVYWSAYYIGWTFKAVHDQIGVNYLIISMESTVILLFFNVQSKIVIKALFKRFK